MGINKLVHQIYFYDGANVVAVSPTAKLPTTGDWLTNAQYTAGIRTDYPLPAGQITTLTPQTDALTDTQLRANPVPISGTVTITPSGTQNVDVTANSVGLATSAKQQEDALTDAELRATPVPVSGTVTVTPSGTQNVDVTANSIGLATSAKQQEDALTDAELRATAVPVSGTVISTPSGTQNVDVTANSIGLATSAKQQEDALTDAELRATAVPVSLAASPLPTGAATAAKQQEDALTDTQLRATAVPVSGTVSVTGLQTNALTDAELRATAVPVSFTPSGTQDVDVIANSIGLATEATAVSELAKLTEIDTAIDTQKMYGTSVDDGSRTAVNVTDNGFMINETRSHVHVDDGEKKIISVTRSFGGVLSTDQLVIKILNPSDSGVNFHITSIIIVTNVSQFFRFIPLAVLVNDTVDTGAVRNSNLGFSNATEAVIRVTTTQPSSGIDWPGRLYVSSNVGSARLTNGDYSPLIKIPPGKDLAIAGSSAAVQVTSIWLTYIEDAVV